MLTKEVTYTDFNDDQVTETLHFNLSKAELVEMEWSQEGGLGAHIERIVKTNDGKQIMAAFKKLILAAYGQKSPDGKRFVKTQQMREEFESSEAYSTLFMELCTSPEAAAEFINGIVPQDMAKEVAALEAKVEASSAATSTITPRVLNRQEVLEMDDAELRSGLAEGRYTIAPEYT